VVVAASDSKCGAPESVVHGGVSGTHTASSTSEAGIARYCPPMEVPMVEHTVTLLQARSENRVGARVSYVLPSTQVVRCAHEATLNPAVWSYAQYPVAAGQPTLFPLMSVALVHTYTSIVGVARVVVAVRGPGRQFEHVVGAVLAPTWNAPEKFAAVPVLYSAPRAGLVAEPPCTNPPKSGGADGFAPLYVPVSIKLTFRSCAAGVRPRGLQDCEKIM
jgi:hypothetical protein